LYKILYNRNPETAAEKKISVGYNLSATDCSVLIRLSENFEKNSI